MLPRDRPGINRHGAAPLALATSNKLRRNFKVPHQELDTKENNDVHNILQRVHDGLDLYNRSKYNSPGIKFMRKADKLDIPLYVQQHPTRFAYLLNRHVLDSGFIDLHKFQEELPTLQQ